MGSNEEEGWFFPSSESPQSQPVILQVQVGESYEIDAKSSIAHTIGDVPDLLTVLNENNWERIKAKGYMSVGFVLTKDHHPIEPYKILPSDCVVIQTTNNRWIGFVGQSPARAPGEDAYTPYVPQGILVRSDGFSYPNVALRSRIGVGGTFTIEDPALRQYMEIALGNDAIIQAAYQLRPIE
jgi:hypothetical protein